VLVVEDEPSDRAWLERTLREEGYAVEHATTAAEATTLAQARAYDAITLDLLLPDASGWDVLRAIRAGAGPNRRTPVIVATVSTERQAASGFAVHDYLVKPVRREDLLRALAGAGAPARDTCKVLVIDDDPNLLKLARLMLEEEGYRVICATDGEGGLGLAASERPSAVVLDLLMPGMDGFEFLDRFRHTPEGVTTPVIVWTVKDLSAEETRRLLGLSQAVVTKRAGDASRLLGELAAHVGAAARAEAS
jgi:CheY-like chemotaxis protein